MLPKKYRLKFQEFFRNKNPAKTVFSDRFFLQVKNSVCPNQNRICVLVPKKLDKRSSARNKTKRLILQTVYPLLSVLKTSKDMMIKPKRILKKKEAIFLKQEIENLFSKV